MTKAQPGCTDPQALNYNPAATEDDGSCTYQVVNVAPEWTLQLDERVSETSGLIQWDGVLLTHNDDTDTRLYLLDPSTAEIVGDYMLQGVVNEDWEEISQDDDFIYIGDFGNNGGDRDDLHILRVSKASLKADNPTVDTIWFTFSDQQSLVSQGINQTDFDCEAFIVSKDHIYLFTKQWLHSQTSQYKLPKLPGRHVAQKMAEYNIQGQVTGAGYLEEEHLLVLCGYAGLVQPFLSIFYDYKGDDFFSGIHRRFNLILPFHQVEAVDTQDGIHYYVTNERVVKESFINIPPQLHLFDLSEWMNEYLKRGD